MTNINVKGRVEINIRLSDMFMYLDNIDHHNWDPEFEYRCPQSGVFGGYCRVFQDIAIIQISIHFM
jgi:hypothetical protein